MLRGVLKGFKNWARVGERFPLEDGEGVVDIDRMAHAVEDARDAGCASHGPDGFSGK